MARTFNEGIDAAISLHEQEISRIRATFDAHLKKKSTEGRTVRWKQERSSLLASIDTHKSVIASLCTLKETI